MTQVETWIGIHRNQEEDYRIAPNQGVDEKVAVRVGHKVHRSLGELATHLTGISSDPNRWVVARVLADDGKLSAADSLGFHDVLDYIPAATDFIPLGNAVSQYPDDYRAKLHVEKV